MAFNLKGEEEGQLKESERPQPILHTPKTGGGMRVKLLVSVFVVVVLAAAGFLTYNSFFKGKGQAPAPKIVQELPPGPPATDTTHPVVQPQGTQPEKPQPQQQTKQQTQPHGKQPAQQPPAIAKKETTPPATKKTATAPEITTAPKKEAPPKPKQTPETSATGEYTIYIGSYKTKATAEDEVNRWNEAGYQAYLSEQGGWYRVALGKYATREKAREQAEKLKEAFEAGYWVDKFK